MGKLHLAFGLTFADLYRREGLERVDAAFIHALKGSNIDLFNRFVKARALPGEIEAKDESNLLIELAPYVEDFIGSLFGCQKEVIALQQQHHELAPIYTCKRLFVQRRAPKLATSKDISVIDGERLTRDVEELIGGDINELRYSQAVNNKMEEEEANLEALSILANYALWALDSDEGKQRHKYGVLFKRPHKLDFDHLVPVETEVIHGVTVLKMEDEKLRYREGFKMTDPGYSLKKALDDANYCIYCHNQGKDSCSKGYKEKDGSFKVSPTKVTLTGCPLEEKISEMNIVSAQGYAVGALAIVTVDNPMCAGTGHRICNDCMKGCIYQKQEPVNIPQVETKNLENVLHLPWGFEIYSLLTRWNPLNLHRPLPRVESGYKILVAGLGPAGYTLAHHLLNDGHTIVAIDGLKIEPLPVEISGITPHGERVPFEPIKQVQQTLFEPLDTRTVGGFGGVAEYGITVRWDKNYLKVIRLLLERRESFRMYSGIRFGSNITYDDAKELGFDHIALCMGAGKPTVLDIPNAMARGVRTASDFLMALQLTGAAKSDSIANLQVRLPVVVIGGGLTGIDTATEALAYYPIQVEKYLSRYETLVAHYGQEAIERAWNSEERELAQEMMSHAKAIRDERERALSQQREPDIISLLRQWGGSSLVYRRPLSDAPSYRLNHEEVEMALQEGIYVVENANPLSVEVDGTGHAAGLLVSIREEVNGEVVLREQLIPARTIFFAAGTSPNTVLHREDPEHFAIHGKYFQAVSEDGSPVEPDAIAKPEQVQVLLSIDEEGKAVSFFGDLHPSFAGNVVKAMGSAKQGYPVVSRILSKAAPRSAEEAVSFFKKLDHLLIATVKEIIRLTPTIVEVVVQAPLAARHFEPGQFYRLQNFERFALKVTGDHQTTLAMEGLALTGAWVDKEQGLMSTIVLEMGGSSNLCAHLHPGEPVVLMGPTGTPTHITSGETVMLVGGGLGNAVLFSIGKALREAGSKVLYIAGYKKLEDRYKVKEIEDAADVIVWACDEGKFPVERSQDASIHGNIIEAIVAYAKGDLGLQDIDTHAVDRIIAIGSDRMMAAVGQARHGVLKPFLKSNHTAIGSINSPMQCMMKEICAQCLQKHIDPKTGREYYVYSCFNQDQHLDEVSFPHLNERLKQNTVQEKLTTKWIEFCLYSLKASKAS
ncbi:MAG: FAD-dependent oxidoreductase [Alphaproteobacteria bacterium]|nr:FAD-dependent oxidoreductase [Alphaproteobacteria bacterium]